MIPSDLVVYNGNLITLARPGARAEGMVVVGGEIALIGTSREVLAAADIGAIRIDLGGATVVPGFCDAHLHLASYGVNLLRQADLVGARDVDEVLSRLSDHAAARSEGWIQGRGFDQEVLAGGRWPERADLDRVSATRPMLVTRICGHAGVVNTAALRLLTPAQQARGNPETGRFAENALAPFHALLPHLSDSEMERAITLAANVALATGITSVGTLLDPPFAAEQLRAFQNLRDRSELPVRVTAMPPYAMMADLHCRGIKTGDGDDWLRTGGVKLFTDGSLGARTALLRTPYADDPGNTGIQIHSLDDLRKMVADAHDAGFQAVLHAIGDRAVADAITAIEDAMGQDSSNAVRRHRVEHASLLPADLLSRMADHGIVAVVQPQFVASDSWIPQRVGPERAATAYPFRAMLSAGIPLALSSDCPIEPLDAFACLHAAVNRAPWSETGGLEPEEALRAYCLGGAYSLHAEKHTGSLTSGKAADFVVLTGDPTTCPPSEILAFRAAAVYVAGVRREISG